MSQRSVLTRAPEQESPWRPGFFSAALAGVVAVGLTFGVAELLAALGTWLNILHTAASPLNSLGEAFIDLTPGWLKEFATKTFGLHDKDVLKAGMGLVIAIVAAVVGLTARRDRRIALGITGVLVVVALVAIFTRAGAGPLDALPVLIGAIVGAEFLWRVFRPVGPAPEVENAPVPDPDDAATTPRGKTVRVADQHPMIAAIQRLGLDRRAFFRLTGLAAAAAVVSGVLTRIIPNTAEVQASRDRAAEELGLTTGTAPAATAAGTSPVAGSSSVAGASAAVPTSGAASTGLSRVVIPAAADLDINGLATYVTPSAQFYRIDTALTPPRLTAEKWALKVHGMVNKEIQLDYAALTKRPQIERAVTLTCVSNEVGGDLVSNAVWIGTPLGDLLKEAGPQSGADCVLATSVDGFTSTSPLDALTDGRDAMLAVAMNGEPLPIEHGFPVRMVVPGLYGYVSATKWVVDLKVSTFAAESAYWTQRGWSDHGPIKTSSRIDVPKDGSHFDVGHTVTIAGMAWAQHRGISKVEVKIDNGAWQTAELSEAFSKDTWRQWKLTWTATSGSHTLTCRATDATGAVQVSTVQDVIPDGATGYHSIGLSVG